MQSGALSQGPTPTASSGPAHRSAAAKAWGTLLSAFALVARHDPRPRVADTAGAALLVSRPFLLTCSCTAVHQYSRSTALCLLLVLHGHGLHTYRSMSNP